VQDRFAGSKWATFDSPNRHPLAPSLPRQREKVLPHGRAFTGIARRIVSPALTVEKLSPLVRIVPTQHAEPLSRADLRVATVRTGAMSPLVPIQVSEPTG